MLLAEDPAYCHSTNVSITKNYRVLRSWDLFQWVSGGKKILTSADSVSRDGIITFTFYWTNVRHKYFLLGFIEKYPKDDFPEKWEANDLEIYLLLFFGDCKNAQSCCHGDANETIGFFVKILLGANSRFVTWTIYNLINLV